MTTEAERDALLAKLSEGIADLTSSDNWRQYLQIQAQFPHYSARNAMLILCQDPYATRVASYRRWQSMGRQVQKGQHGLSILAPLIYQQINEETGEKQGAIKGFRLVSVFDVAQTEGDPLPEITTKLLGNDPDGLFDHLSQVARGLGFTVTDATFEDERNGDCNHESMMIRVKRDNAPAQRVKTLAHELGHAMLHCTPADRIERTLCELEAESVAYVVCQSLGLETSDYSFGYVAGWAGDAEKAQELIMASASRIQKSANAIVSQVEEAVEVFAVAQGVGQVGAVSTGAVARTIETHFTPSDDGLVSAPALGL